QIRGLGPITMSVPDLRRTDLVLTEVMNMRRVREYQAADNGQTAVIHVYQMGADGPAAELHVRVDAGMPAARQGAGGVHHVAFRTPNDEEYQGWIEQLAKKG